MTYIVMAYIVMATHFFEVRDGSQRGHRGVGDLVGGPEPTLDHNYIRHSHRIYMDQNGIGQSGIGYNHIGDNCTGHNYIGRVGMWVNMWVCECVRTCVQACM